MDHFYNTRPPTPEESRLIVGTGEVMQVKCVGDLDMALYCDEDVVVTLREVSFVPGLWYELTSFNIIQETENIVLNRGAYASRTGAFRQGEKLELRAGYPGGEGFSRPSCHGGGRDAAW